MRKQQAVKVPDEQWAGRDKNKHFLITEWSAAKAEHWAFRALIAYNRGGGEVPMEMITGGMNAIFLVGVNTFLRGQMQANEVIPILDELLECVKIIRDPKSRAADGTIIATDLVSDDDIEETVTRLWLRSEVIRLHTNFSPFELISALIEAAMKGTELSESNQPTSPTSLQ